MADNFNTQKDSTKQAAQRLYMMYQSYLRSATSLKNTLCNHTRANEKHVSANWAFPGTINVVAAHCGVKHNYK